MKDITIILPVYNWETTLQGLFESLEYQNNKELIDKIIIINDKSSDNSIEIINNFQVNSAYKIEIIDNKYSLWLAWNYNLWIGLTKTDYFILMHQDIEIIWNNSYENLLFKIKKNNLFCLYPIILHENSNFSKSSFWQKAMFSRDIGKKIKNLEWKFDIFDTNIFKKIIKKFDDITFRTAWEDSDLKIKISILWLKTDCSWEEINHIHYRDNNFSIKSRIKKEAQLSEAEGVLLRLYFTHKIKNIKFFILVYFRQALLIIIFIWILINNLFCNFLLLFILFLYIFLYTKIAYFEKWNLLNKFKLPFINLFILFVSFFYWIKWFFTKNQKI